MDAVNHMAEGLISHYLIALLINIIFPLSGTMIYLISATGIIGIVPDLDLMYGKFYVSAHKGTLNKWMRWIPAWGLHTFQDSFLHDDGKRWWIMKERGWYEILSWILVITFLIIRFF